MSKGVFRENHSIVAIHSESNNTTLLLYARKQKSQDGMLYEDALFMMGSHTYIVNHTGKTEYEILAQFTWAIKQFPGHVAITKGDNNKTIIRIAAMFNSTFVKECKMRKIELDLTVQQNDYSHRFSESENIR